MNRLVHQSKVAAQQPTKPQVVRRTIRYRAADNAREAIRRQYPGMFMSPAVSPQGSAHHA